jgi:glutamine synthetase
VADLVMSYILPVAIQYQNKIIENVRGIKELGFGDEFFCAQADILKRISKHISVIKSEAEKMVEGRKKANKIENPREKAIEYCENVKSHFDTIRYHVDKLELLVEDDAWPLPKYRELLFIK